MEPFWCLLPDASEVLPGRAWGKLHEAPACPSSLWLPKGPSCSLSSPLTPVMEECLPSLCWLWCFSDPFVSWTSSKWHKEIPLNHGKLLAGKEGGRKFGEETHPRPWQQPLQLSGFLWDLSLKRDLCFLYLLHAVTSSCAVSWVREVVWLKNNCTKDKFPSG